MRRHYELPFGAEIVPGNVPGGDIEPSCAAFYLTPAGSETR
jgi:hypothetical protein